MPDIHVCFYCILTLIFKKQDMLQLSLIRQIVLNEICNMFFSLPLFLRLNHPYVHVCLSAAFYVPLVF